MVNSLSVVTHALDPDDSLLSEHPTQEISHCVLVAEVAKGKHLIAEEVERADQEGSGVVEALHTGSESDGCACADCVSSVVILGESSGLSTDEIVQLIILVIDKVQPNSTVKQWLFPLIFREERGDSLIIERRDKI